MANIDKLKAVLAKIKADPKSWDQSVWICGTAACFAGHAVLMEGARPASPSAWFQRYRPVTSHTDRAVLCGVTVDVSTAAEVILGLTPSQAGCLFEQENELEDLERMVAALARGESNLEPYIEDRDERFIESRQNEATWIPW
jgi:hypothetical protein